MLKQCNRNRTVGAMVSSVVTQGVKYYLPHTQVSVVEASDGAIDVGSLVSLVGRCFKFDYLNVLHLPALAVAPDIIAL